jgi:hypothetical protein
VTAAVSSKQERKERNVLELILQGPALSPWTKDKAKSHLARTRKRLDQSTVLEELEGGNTAHVLA